MTKQEWQILRDAIAAWPYFEQNPPGREVSPGWSTCLGPNEERWPTVAVAEHRFGRPFDYHTTRSGAMPANTEWQPLHYQIMDELAAALGTPSLSSIMYRHERSPLLAQVEAVIRMIETYEALAKESLCA